MTPAPETLLLTLDVELCPKFCLKCKQLWHFITKFAIVFQNTPYYKFQGHSHLPLWMFQLQVDPPCHTGAGRRRCQNHRSQLFRNHTQLSLLAVGLCLRKCGISTSCCWIGTKKRKKKSKCCLWVRWPWLVLPGFPRASTWVWGMGRDRKEAQVLLNAWAGANMRSEDEGRVWHEGKNPSVTTCCLPASPYLSPYLLSVPTGKATAIAKQFLVLLVHPRSFSAHELIDNLIT